MKLRKITAVLFALVILACGSQAMFAKNYIGGGFGFNYGSSAFGLIPNVEVTYDINSKWTIEGFAGLYVSTNFKSISIYADAAAKWNALSFNFAGSNLGNLTLGLQAGVLAKIGISEMPIELGITAGIFANWKINNTWRVYISSASEIFPILPFLTYNYRNNTSVVGVEYSFANSSALRAEFRYLVAPTFVLNYGKSF